MIIPIGDNCHTQNALKKLNLRKVSLPFDWINLSDLSKNSDILLKLLNLKEDEIESYVNDFFNFEKNVVYTDEYKTTIFKNVEYNITFPHDNVNDILSKYQRRFKRLYNSFYSSDSILILFSTRFFQPKFIQELLYLIHKLRKLRNDIYFFTINGLSNNVYNKLLNFTNITLEFKKELQFEGWTKEKEQYDQEIYAPNLERIITLNFDFLKEFTKIRIGVVSLAIGEKYKECMKLGIESKVKYCLKHKYDFIQDESVYFQKGFDRPIAWSKILLVKEYLDKYDYIVWMDADTIILNDNIKLEDIISEYAGSKNFLFTRDLSQVINSGVFFVKSSEVSSNFLDLIYSKEEFKNDEVWEQASINYIYDENINNFRNECVILPLEKQVVFNCCIGLYKQGMFLVHFYGVRSMTWVQNRFRDFCPWRREEDENQDDFEKRMKWIEDGFGVNKV